MDKVDDYNLDELPTVEELHAKTFLTTPPSDKKPPKEDPKDDEYDPK